MRCTDCGDPNGRSFGQCPPCMAAATDRERTAQGLPLEPSDETMRRLAVILASRPGSMKAAS